MRGPDRRELARRLEALADFTDPTADLEQYLTPAELAAHVIHLARVQGDLEGGETGSGSQPIVDLGTGTGVLGIGAALAGAPSVVGIDVDRSALAVARENVRRVGTETTIASRLEWVQGDVTRHPFDCSRATVVSNPPFGAQHGNRHADRAFLETAREIAAVSYTIHNTGSQSFVESFVADAGGEVTHAFRAPFPVEHRFDFHTAAQAELEVEVFRIEWSG
ncbi:METTL5 family protein [Natrarchaeobaculum aegyptiacum]|uniref:RNA methyltransferase n=1 Tax=Natrarchaeobaculum aegyptiacum TaxID=745377 RepID=A0A2Z2HW58_9EURY|nr:METTL5 family protein [Natrarchaeobaculum aegyptiacum]ARS91556.1 RNA methyltransferase [Natrarchaeobaculum aegyptiacum]